MKLIIQISDPVAAIEVAEEASDSERMLSEMARTARHLLPRPLSWTIVLARAR
jgi:hypothetical protein